MSGSDPKSPCYTATTQGITVSVHPVWIEEQSDPDERNYVWLYRITIENNSPHPVQLLSRIWVLVDAYGQREEIHGIGVVGEQPVIKPGEHYAYSSNAELKAPSGIMFGHYQMICPEPEKSRQKARRDLHEPFNIDIPAFSLDCPHEQNVQH